MTRRFEKHAPRRQSALPVSGNAEPIPVPLAVPPTPEPVPVPLATPPAPEPIPVTIPAPQAAPGPQGRIWDGRPGEYTLVRTVNNGLVIDRRWDKFQDFHAIEARIFDERKHSHAGTLFRGGKVVEAWGGKPARL